LAQAAQLEGEVVLEVTVGADGKVGRVVVKKSVHGSLNDAAIDAVRRSQYSAGTRNGVPTEMNTTTTVLFKLRR